MGGDGCNAVMPPSVVVQALRIIVPIGQGPAEARVPGFAFLFARSGL